MSATPPPATGLPILRIMLLALLVLSSATPATAANQAPVTGRLTLTGSTALSNLASLWAEAFREHQPAVVITLADPGSAVGLESLLNGSADAVLVSQPLSPGQRQRFIDRYNYPPRTTPVARDGVAIFVNTANPLAGISLPQLDAIYSRTRRCGAPKPIRRWDDLGVAGELARLPIEAVGLSDDSGAYYLFRHKALCGGDFRADFKALPGPGGVQAAIGHDRAAIGFASSTLRDPGLRALPVAARNGEAAIAPSAENIRRGQYPLSRTLAIAYNLPPGREIPPALHAFLDFARSAQGQAIAVKAGYVQYPENLP